MSQPHSPDRSIFISSKQVSELEAFSQFTGIPAEKLLQSAIDDWLYFNGPVVVGTAPARTTAHIIKFPGKPNLWGN
jgi:hypothetical protein